MIPLNLREEDYSFVRDAIVAVSDTFYREFELKPRPGYVYFGNIPVQKPLSELGSERLSNMTPGFEQYGGYVVFQVGNCHEKRCTIREFNGLIRGLGRQAETFSKRTTIISLQPVIPEINGFGQSLEARLIDTGKFLGDYQFDDSLVSA